MSLSKKTIFLLLLFIGSVASVQAKKKIEGYYTRFGSDERITVTFVVPIAFSDYQPNYFRMWDGIDYLKDDGETGTIYPDHVSEVHFVYLGKEIVLRSCFDNLRIKRKIFMHLIVDGTVCLYDYYVFAISYASGTKENISRTVMRRNDGPIAQVGQVFYKTDLMEFLSDCPLITEQVKSGALQGVANIITKYNFQCNN